MADPHFPATPPLPNHSVPADPASYRIGHHPTALASPHAISPLAQQNQWAAMSPWGHGIDLDSSGPRLLTPKTLTRALRRYWWQFLLFWIIGSVVLAILAYTQIKPTYSAFATLEVVGSIWESNSNDPRDFDREINTHAENITNPNVLELMLKTNSDLIHQPTLSRLNPAQHQQEIRSKIRVTRGNGTRLIQVSMATRFPGEAVMIVNALTQAFLTQQEQWMKARSDRWTTPINELKIKAQREVEEARKKESELVAQVEKQRSPINDKNPNLVSREFYDQQKSDLFREQEKLKGLKGFLDSLENRRVVLKPKSAGPSQADVEDQIETDDVALRMSSQVSSLQNMLETAEARTRNKSDGILKEMRQNLKQAQEKLDQYVAGMRRRLTRAAANSDENPVTAHEQIIERAKNEVDLQEAIVNAQRELLKRLDINPNSEGASLIQLEYARAERLRAEEYQKRIEGYSDLSTRLAQSPPPIDVRSNAQPNAIEMTDHRLRTILVIPLAWGLAGFLLFLLLEIRASRVNDPEEVTDRLRLPVIGVVPPLPDPRSETRARSLKRRIQSQREIDLFVQCLDHLRVVLCSPGPLGALRLAASTSHRRCVLITSAVGGEGKTTLAAQLAGRCANAGLTTLLIDADLRNPSLTWRLDAHEGPGLVEALQGSVDPESTLRLIEDGGGFHLMPAGTAQPDPSRLLQGDHLGQLIARFRSVFDIVIIDAPPILPVPDALLIGRWTDGAIMAVRKETSRYPLIQGARQRLNAVGVPVLGVVVNGVKPHEATYGYSYANSYGSSQDLVVSGS